MHQFVWARALYEIRIRCPAAVDCNGTTRKIHVRKIEREQSAVHDGKYCRFYDLGTFDEATGTLQSPGVRADAQCCKITWLEELASESNTIQAQEDIVCQGRLRAISR